MRKLQTIWPGMMGVGLLLFLLLAYPDEVTPHSLPEAEDRASIPAVSSLRPRATSSLQVLPNTEAALLEPQTAAAVAENVEFVGHIGGATYAVFVEGNYAYIGVGPRLTILNIANPVTPTVIGRTIPLPGVIQDVYVYEGYAYVADGGLRVIDIGTPATPVEVGFCDMAGWANSVVVSGTYAYVADGSLRVVDISTPTAPVEVGFYDTGNAQDVAVAGSYVYVADYQSGLRVVDVSTPSDPVEVGFYSIPGNARDVAVVGSYAYVVEYGSLRVIDVSMPSAPVEVGFYDTPEVAQDVAVVGSYAYVADNAGLRIVNVNAPSTPVEVGYCDMPGSAWRVVVAGTYAYVAVTRKGLWVMDVSAPASLGEVGFYDTEIPGETRGVVTVGTYAYVADVYSGLRVVDVSTPSAPVEVGFCDTLGNAYGVAVAGTYAYVAAGYSGLRVVDVSIPAVPVEVGIYYTGGLAQGVAVSGTYAYVAAGSLRVVDISTPTAPVEVGFYEPSGSALDVAVAGHYAYVVDYSGLRVVDVSTPSDPVEVGFYDTVGNSHSVAVAGAYAYVAESNGLLVVDVSIPAVPVEVGMYFTPGSAYGIAIAMPYAYVADLHRHLRVVDVSTPSDLVEVGYYDTSGSAFGVAMAGVNVYVANGDGGLFILRYTGPSTPALSPIINTDGDGDYTVDWSDATGAISYTLQEDDNFGFTSPVTRYIGSNSEYTVNGQDGGIWYYRVRATNTVGESDWGNIESVDVTPAAPTLALIANGDGDGDYLVDWLDVSSTITYTLQEDNNVDFISPITCYSGSNSEHTVSGQTGGIWYYRVRAANTAGEGGWSNIESVGVKPLVPTLVPIANEDEDGNYAVYWSEVPGTISYTLQEDDNASFTSPAIRYVGSNSEYAVSSQAGGVWYYRVRAANTAGESDWSNVESVGVKPAAPTLAPIANTDGDGNYTVDWSDVTGAISYTLQEDDNANFTSPTNRYNGSNSEYAVSGHETGVWYYRVQAANTVGGSDWSNVESVSVIPTATALTPIVNGDGDGDYIVVWSEVTGAMTYTLQEDDNANFTSPATRYNGSNSEYAVSSQAGGVWYYRVQAANTAGESAWSNIEVVGVKPTAPTITPIANLDGDGNYTVDWSDATGALTYTLQEADSSDFASSITRYTGSDSEYAVSGQAGGVWYYRVCAVNTAGESAWSNIVAVAVKPAAPMLAPIVPGDETYTVDWSNVVGATSYTLQEDDNPNFTSPTIRYAGGSSEYVVSDQPEGIWYYRVHASNAAGDSAWSNVQSTVVLDIAGELAIASPYVFVGQTGYFLAELRAAGQPAPGLDGVHLRVGDREISLNDDGSQGDFAAADSLYGTSVPFTQTGTFQVTLLHGSRELDSVAVTVIDDPALVILTDWPALYAEFRDTGMAVYEDENDNQRHDLIELIERLRSYSYQQRGVVINLPEALPEYAILDYGHNTETRVQMGHRIDQVIAVVNAQANNRIQNVVLLGDDQVMPFYRVYDPTDFYNEFNQNYPLDYQSREIAYPATIGGTQENATLLDSQAGYIMSDVPYGIRAQQVITPGTWLSMYPDLPRWATYPEPEMGVGRIFAPRPSQLSAAISRYQKPLFMTPGSAEAALFRTLNESGDVGTGVDFSALAERSLFPTLRDWFGANLDDYDQVAQPWNAVDFAAALGQHNLVSWWGHTTHQSLQAGPGTVIDWHVFPQIVISEPVAFVGLGCHLGYSVGRYPDGGGPVYPYDWGVVNALIAQGVTFYAPSSQAYTWPTAFKSPNLHELVIAQFTNRLMDYTASTVGAVWQMGFRPYHITDPAVVENNNPATRVFHIAAAYGNILYGLPTQPIEREQQTPLQVSYHAAPSLSARAAVDTIILPSITVEVPHFQTEQLGDGTTLFSVPNDGTHLAPTNGPALPLVIRTLTLPANVTVQNVRLVDVESQVYDRPVTLARPQFTTSNGEVFTGTYELPAIYPENRYQYRITQTPEGQQLILGAIPLLYDTARNRVTLQTRMQFAIDYQTTAPATGPQIISMTINGGLPVAINTLNQQIVADIYHDQEVDAWVAWSVLGQDAFVIASGTSPVMVLADKTTRVTIPLDTTGWRPGPKDLAVYLLYEDAISDSENIPLMAEGLGLDDLNPVHHVYTVDDPVAVWQIAVRDETGALVAGLEDALHVSVDGQSTAAETQAGETGIYNVRLPLDGVASGNHLVRISVTDTRNLTGLREWSLTKLVPASVQVFLPLVLRGN